MDSQKYNKKNFRSYVVGGHFDEDVGLFKTTLFQLHGLTGHPKSEALFALAWDYGHAEGLESVAYIFEDFSILLS